MSRVTLCDARFGESEVYAVPSFIWLRDPQEAFENPYEYGAQEQFVREATLFLGKMYGLLSIPSHRYTVDDRSPTKAAWMLAMDALDSLCDCLRSLQRKEHRVAGRLFRDVVETSDLACFFVCGGPKATSALEKWYAGEVVPHRCYRDYVETVAGKDAKFQLAEQYSALSRFTHRSYTVLLHGYVQEHEGRLAHDRSHKTYRISDEEGILVLPETMAIYYALLGSAIQDYVKVVVHLGLVCSNECEAAFAASVESLAVPRRFTPSGAVLARYRARIGNTSEDEPVPATPPLTPPSGS
jgi:hypothetical protein